MLFSGASASEIEKALNDLPTLGPNQVTVTDSLADDGVSQIYSVSFSSDLGNVDYIEEVFGLVNFTINETISGSPSENKFQLNIGNFKTNLFSANNATSVSYLI